MSAGKESKDIEKGPEKEGSDRADVAASENLDSVRNILFGAQMRDAERRYARLERRVAKEIGDLGEEMRKRVESLETHFNKEIESLASALKGDQESHEEHANASAQRFADIEKNAAKHSEGVATTLRDLRQQILDQSKTLRDEISQKQEKVSATLDRETKDLRDGKVDRSILGTLLTEMGMRLCDDSVGEQNES